jgi:hypothetical protein
MTRKVLSQYAVPLEPSEEAVTADTDTDMAAAAGIEMFLRTMRPLREPANFKGPKWTVHDCKDFPAGSIIKER